MNKSKAITGDNSNVTQIGTLNVLENFKGTFTVNHCGNCNKFIEYCHNRGIENFRLTDGLHHCKNLEKISNISSYILYHYDILMNRHVDYIKPTLTIMEGNSDIGATVYEEYDHMDFFIEHGFHKYLVIGEGGIGKSTFLSELFYTLIVHSLEKDCTIIPLWVNCDYFGRDNVSPHEWLYHSLSKKFPYLPIESLIRNQKNQVIFLIDALNSLQYTNEDDYIDKIASWSQFVEEYCDLYNNVSFVISSREMVELNCFDSSDEKRVYLLPLSPKKIGEFIGLFVKEQKAQERLNTLVNSHSDMRFIGIPFFLKKLIETQERNVNVNNKTEIVLLYLKTLFDKNDKSRGEILKQKNVCFGQIHCNDIKVNEVSFFEVMFLAAFICQKQNKKVLNEDDIKSICECFNAENIDKILSIALEEHIMEKNGSVYSFSHPILQEILTAIHIHKNLNENYSCDDIILFNDKAMNIEVLPHLYNMENNKEYFIKLLIERGEIIYAAECVVNNGENLKKVVVNSIISTLETSVDIKTISTLSPYLGLIGDTRFNLKSDYIEPNLTTVAMLDGLKISIYPVTNLEFKKFIDDRGYKNEIYWSEAINDNWFNYDIIQQKMFEFWSNIRYRFNNNENALIDFCREQAVDIEQCACLAWFLSVSDSDLMALLRDLYREEKYLQPLLWNDPRYNNPSQPVVGVSYYEVKAYCHWLSDKTGKKFRLLHQEEWEVISRAEKYKYVFDGDVSNINCNTIESKINEILPVGVLFKNRTPEGIFDLNGNIFEWTDTIYRDHTDPLQRQYIVKGGSWIQGKERATSKYVGRAKTWCRNLDVGFRVCLDEND